MRSPDVSTRPQSSSRTRPFPHTPGQPPATGARHPHLDSAKRFCHRSRPRRESARRSGSEALKSSSSLATAVCCSAPPSSATLPRAPFSLDPRFRNGAYRIIHNMQQQQYGPGDFGVDIRAPICTLTAGPRIGAERVGFRGRLCDWNQSGPCGLAGPILPSRSILDAIGPMRLPHGPRDQPAPPRALGVSSRSRRAAQSRHVRRTGPRLRFWKPQWLGESRCPSSSAGDRPRQGEISAWHVDTWIPRGVKRY